MAATAQPQQKKTLLMTEGSIWKSILLFSVPLILGNLLQQLYNTADSIIVGNFVGSNALAAVGSSGSPIFLLIGFSQGIAVGAGVVVAQYLGAKDREDAQRAVHTALALAVLLGLILTIGGILVSRALLTAMDTPAEVLEDAVTYIQIYFGGVLFSVVYNMAAGILNAAGNSQRSLLYLGIASGTNILLDLVLIAGLRMGVAGAAIATVIGTTAAVGIHKLRSKWYRAVMNTVTDIPMTNPDIVTGVALALLFAFAGTILKTNSVLGFWTLLIAHITFNLPYVILNVMPKLQQMDKDLVEAALDLGCTPFQSFTKVVIHEIMPGIISGALMAFTMSLDDFVISYFVTGSSFITLPVEIYNYTKKPIQPKIYALFTLMFIVILVLMVVMNLLQAKSEKNRQQPRRARV